MKRRGRLSFGTGGVRMIAPATVMSAADARLEALAARIHDEAERLAYPSGDWLAPVADGSGRPIYDVVIVGAGQSGMAVAYGLIRDGVGKHPPGRREPRGLRRALDDLCPHGRSTHTQSFRSASITDCRA
jgi:hypothetical protein